MCVRAWATFFSECAHSIHWLSLCVSAYVVVKSQFRVLLTNQHCSVVGPVLGSRSVNRQLLGAPFAAKTSYENIRSYPIPPNTALRSRNVSLFLIPCHCRARPVAFYSKAIVIKWEPILSSIAPVFPRISSHLASPSLHYFRDASIFVPPANNSFHPPSHRFPPNYCMSPFHPAAPSFPNHSLHLLSLGLHRSLSLVTLSVFFAVWCLQYCVFVCWINILWAPWWRVFTAGQTAPAEPPRLPACLLISKPAREPFSLISLSPSLPLSLSIAFFSGTN